MSGVELSEAAQDSVLTCKKHNVRREGGMQNDSGGLELEANQAPLSFLVTVPRLDDASSSHNAPFPAGRYQPH
jgi:hypothetical protein